MITFLPINDLIPHEDTESDRVLRILVSILNSKIITKPIIVEEKKKIIIDGHHRLKALKAIGVPKVPVFTANYDKDINDIGRWMYVETCVNKNDRTIRIRKKILNFIENLEALSKRGNARIYVKIGNQILNVNVDPVDTYIAIKFLKLTSYLTNLVKTPANLRKCTSSEICILMPKLSVEDIYKIYLKGITLAPRSTLHKTYLKKIKVACTLKILSRNKV